MIREIIKEAMELHKVGASALADAIGISKSGMASFLSGKSNLSQSKIENVFNTLGIEFVIKQPQIKQRPLNKRDTIWHEMFNCVKSYHTNIGTWPSSYSADKRIKKLGLWCVNQRQYKKIGKISDIRKQMLDSIGFDWGEVLNDKWLETFEALKSYREKVGKWPYRKSDNKDEARLAAWLYSQRSIVKGNKGCKMPLDHLEKLESINFMECDYRGKQK